MKRRDFISKAGLAGVGVAATSALACSFVTTKSLPEEVNSHSPSVSVQ